MRYVSGDGAYRNSRVAGAGRLIIGGFAVFLVRNGVVFLKE